jgi:hypothetical protein
MWILPVEHKKQHYIPQSYLSAWADPETPEGQEPYVWVVNKESLDIRNRAPKNIMFKRDFYTTETEKGERDLRLEKGLSVFEGEFVQVRDHVIEPHKQLSPDDQMVLIAYISAMHSRTPASIDRFNPMYEELLDKMKAMSKWAETASPAQLESTSLHHPIDSERSYEVSINDIQSIVDSPMPSLLPSSIMAEIEALSVLDLAILETTTCPGFITSDNPVVWFDPEGYNRNWPNQGPALIYPSIEISMAISPKYCLFLNRQGVNGYINLSKLGPLDEIKRVNNANLRVQASAKTSIIVSRNIIYWNWFNTLPEK